MGVLQRVIGRTVPVVGGEDDEEEDIVEDD